MKKDFTLRSVFLIIMMISTLNSFSQDRTCGMVEYMKEQMKDPEFAREYKQNQEMFKARLHEVLANGDLGRMQDGTIEIPVAVHFPTGNESDRACLEALAQTQIDVLNADYTATNSDISNWTSASPFYPITNLGPMDVSFCLAVSNHPTGLDPELLEGNPCVTIGYNFGGGNNFDSNWSGYMNFVVRDLGGLLGFSPLGGSVSAGYAVTIDVNAFGTGAGCSGSGIVPQAPYNLGRTTTHELGHFYNLNHTFIEDGNPNLCGQPDADGIADTPKVSSSSYGCPSAGSVAGCVPGEYSLTMNYMDYVDDACMYMFSAGQAIVAETYLSGILQAQFKQNVCSVPQPGFEITANNSPVFSCPTTDNEAVFNLSYSTILGFNETTTFSATGLPAGATVSFSPTNINTSGNFTMTIGNLSATAQGSYTITVTGTSATVTESVDVILNNTCTSIQCDTYSSAQNLNLSIPDGGSTDGTMPGTPLLNTINIPESNTIESVKVNVDISHTYLGDLYIVIIHPDGSTYVELYVGDCAGDDNIDVTFEDGQSAIVCASPTVGSYAPSSPLSVFNGMDSAGDWQIYVQDYFSQDTGVLNDWSIEICSEQILSVNDYQTITDFTLFPNPNNGSFTVKLHSISNKDITIDVFDIRGRVIFSKSYNNNTEFNQQINLTNVQSGMYMVKVSDGLRTNTQKIIVD